MENKGLLKLPETWHIVITEENRENVFDWFKKYHPYQIMELKYVGFEFTDQMPTQSNNTSNFGQEITFADFKRLVLGEKKEYEIKIVKTWETIYFKSEKATVELTLNHEKNTFDLQTATEEMVSFKKDTVDIARERLKCIEYALNYAEKYLSK